MVSVANMKDDIIIELDRVTKIFGKNGAQTRALHELSFTIRRGEFTAICGPSGSGKSTTLNLIGALDVPTFGEVYIDGRPISKLDAKELSIVRRDQIGFVFQSYNLIPVLTAYENAEFVLGLQNVPAKQRRERVMAMLDAVGLAGFEDRLPDQLSGGQQQRVAIARAMVTEPKLILADEPTANVDSANAIALLDLMEKLNRESGVTFLFSTHDERVMRRASRIIEIQDGQVKKCKPSKLHSAA
jgi:putative ABC transport system ATP-binding protein